MSCLVFCHHLIVLWWVEVGVGLHVHGWGGAACACVDVGVGLHVHGWRWGLGLHVQGACVWEWVGLSHQGINWVLFTWLFIARVVYNVQSL